MTSVVIFIIGLVIFHFTWSSWRKALVGYSRDRLFGLRDDLRQHFVSNNLPLASPAYKHARDFLNWNLRFTEEVSVISALYFGLALKKRPDLLRVLESKAKAEFDSENEETTAFIANLREQVTTIVLLNSLFASPFLAFFALLAIIILPICGYLAIVTRKCQGFLEAFYYGRGSASLETSESTRMPLTQ